MVPVLGAVLTCKVFQTVCSSGHFIPLPEVAEVGPDATSRRTYFSHKKNGSSYWIGKISCDFVEKYRRRLFNLPDILPGLSIWFLRRFSVLSPKQMLS